MKIESPGGLNSLKFKWPIEIKEQHEISHIVRALCEQAEGTQALLGMLNHTDCRFNYKACESLVSKFNASIPDTQRGNGKIWAESEALKSIIELARESAATDLSQLKLSAKYSFSSLVYGELSFDLVRNISIQMNTNESSCLLDLGSGIGQLVLQLAGSLHVKKVIGIEIRDDLAGLSKTLGVEFRRWMKWFGFDHSEFACYEGNFKAPIFEPNWKETTHFLSNNIEFDPATNNFLHDRFMNVTNGSEIYLN